MDESPRCPTCELPLPCLCTTGAGATFTLLPALEAEEVLEEEERFTRLLREVKRDVLRREFVDADDADALTRQARRLDALVDGGHIDAADGVAEGMVASVLEFPRRPRMRDALLSPRSLVLFGASILMAAIVAILVFF